TRLSLCAIGLCLITLAVVRAADQTILGNALTVRNPSTPDKRKITGSAKEKTLAAVIMGDPVADGGFLTITANGGTSSSQTYALPTGTSEITGKPFWSGTITKGFKYKDPKGENGPVKTVQIKQTGTFVIKAVVTGKLGSITVLPPNPGSDGC